MQKVSKPTKLAKKITHFTIKFRSKNLTHITNLNSPDIENNMLPQHSQRPFSLYKFSIKHVSVWCQKKHLYCTLFWRPRTAFLKHFEIKCLYISVYLLKKMFFSKEIVRFYLMESGFRGRLNNFLKVAFCLGLVKCSTMFHFNWNFWKFNCFSAFLILPSIALKCSNFPNNLDFKGKIAPKFLMKSQFLSI